MKKLSHIDTYSLAKFLAAANFFIGLVVGIVITTYATIVGTAAQNVSGWRVFWGTGFLTIILWPLVMALAGLIWGLIYGWVYNVAARWTGGVVVKLEDTRVER